MRSMSVVFSWLLHASLAAAASPEYVQPACYCARLLTFRQVNNAHQRTRVRARRFRCQCREPRRCAATCGRRIFTRGSPLYTCDNGSILRWNDPLAGTIKFATNSFPSYAVGQGSAPAHVRQQRRCLLAHFARSALQVGVGAQVPPRLPVLRQRAYARYATRTAFCRSRGACS